MSCIGGCGGEEYSFQVLFFFIGFHEHVLGIRIYCNVICCISTVENLIYEADRIKTSITSSLFNRKCRAAANTSVTIHDHHPLMSAVRQSELKVSILRRARSHMG